jgi:hypothetical protein
MMTTLYIYDAETMDILAEVTGQTNDACESWAVDNNYTSESIGWTYSPAFGVNGELGAFNKQAIAYLPAINKIIREVGQFESNQIISRTLYMANNSIVPTAEMSKAELARFQNNLIESFKYLGWL